MKKSLFPVFPVFALFAASAVMLAPSTSRANPRPLPFTYTSETLPEGEAEVEQFVDMTPVKGFASSGQPTFYLASQFQTEFEYGITNRVELGLYLTLAPSAPDGFISGAVLPEGNGVKQRLRIGLAEPGAWPIDVSLYGEVVENDREIELEAKVNLQRRIGKARIAANLWAERELYFVNQRDWVLNPTVGVTYEVTPVVQPGIEYWMRAEFPDPAPHPRPFNVGPHHYAGPAMLLNFGRIWSTGVYLRMDDFGRSLQPGDAYGSLWFRTIVGMGF